MIKAGQEALTEIGSRTLEIQANISKATKEFGIKTPARLIAVSKIKPVEDIQKSYDAGQRDFGENYVQELSDKFDKLPKDIRWHFIGHLQSNKVKQVIVPNLAYIHTVDSEKLAQKIDKHCQKIKKTDLRILIQVRTSDEDCKILQQEIFMEK